VFWFLRRPNKTGVKCVLTDGDRVLLVQHTYGRRDWDLPGGSVKRREAPLSAARREMSEELGIAVEEWRPLGTFRIGVDHRRDTLHCFQAELRAPELEIAHAELAAVRWFPRERLPRPRRPFIDPIIARARRANGAR
jgi:8-oxo-dGTP pyrophosphatase MutT (NUDIX family)